MNTKMFTTRFLAAGLLALAFGGRPASAQTLTQSAAIASTASEYSVVQRQPHSRLWQRTVIRTNSIGIVTTNTQSYTEVATGVCYLSNNEYVDSVEEVVSVPGGAQAVQGRHQVQWALNANTPGGAVTVTTPDGKQLSSTVFGLAWYDVATGSNAAIASLTNCNGSIVAPNQVVYSGAFSNLTADICYTYTMAGLSQDIVLRQSPPAPHTFGLADESSILQIYTEFFNPPSPNATAVTNGNVIDDRLLDFGDMKIGIGQAVFINGQNTSATEGSVSKQWIQTNNAAFLIESIPYSDISNQLQQLPQASNLKPGRGSVRRMAFMDLNPVRHNGSMKADKPMTLAKAENSRPRLVVDYDLLSSSANLTLQGDTTYYVSGAVIITNTLTIEGGTVVKYTNNSTAQITAPNIVCETGPYSPGVFTSMNDNSVGSVISASTGMPTNNTSSSYLNYSILGTNSLLFRNLRFSYANYAIGGTISIASLYGYTYPSNNSITIWDCQFINCGCAFYSGELIGYLVSPEFPICLYNVLFSQCGEALSLNVGLSSSYYGVSAVNVTADQVGTFEPGGTNLCYATNCIFTSVTNVSGVSFAYCSSNASSNGVYQTVGAAGYYLAPGSTNRNAGTTNIDPALLADLQTSTTYPPVAIGGYWGVMLTNDVTFFPQAQRNTGIPDLGYHYSPLDYALSIAVSNATVTVLPGTALAASGFEDGFYFYTNGIVNCHGTATSPNYIVRYNTVQEQSNTNWETTSWVASFVTSVAPDSSSASFAFTDWSVLTDDGQFNSYPNAIPVTFQNCQFYGGNADMYGVVTSATNCLFHRVNLYMSDSTTPVSQTYYNNLFFAGELSYTHVSSDTFTFRDNLFDQTAVSLTLYRGHGNPIDICSNNAYVTTTNGVLAPENNDIILTNEPAYQAGALGQYYYPTNLSLIHTGSQLAPAAGLYHYTVNTNNVIEGTNVVSIGFHYVAVGANGLPLDTNGDGIPDYLEDANGNGLADSIEIDWLSAGDLGLTIVITRPANNSIVP